MEPLCERIQEILCCNQRYAFMLHMEIDIGETIAGEAKCPGK